MNIEGGIGLCCYIDSYGVGTCAVAYGCHLYASLGKGFVIECYRILAGADLMVFCGCIVWDDAPYSMYDAVAAICGSECLCNVVVSYRKTCWDRC